MNEKGDLRRRKEKLISSFRICCLVARSSISSGITCQTLVGTKSNLARERLERAPIGKRIYHIIIIIIIIIVYIYIRIQMNEQNNYIWATKTMILPTTLRCYSVFVDSHDSWPVLLSPVQARLIVTTKKTTLGLTVQFPVFFQLNPHFSS